MQQLFHMDTQLAIALLKLTMPTSLCYVSHLFSVGNATAREAILEVCCTLQDVLGHTVLCMHDTLELVVGALGFPKYIRTPDRTYIPITCLPPTDHPYYSQRGFQIVLQVVIYHPGAFTNNVVFSAVVFQPAFYHAQRQKNQKLNRRREQGTQHLITVAGPPQYRCTEH
ncbi:hypothetical protein Y1Q_0014481 [Alligator mississippiensis]|uniref:DDE Tnp4 domain-containing protein n=1 Tax=Alligator mississippiensis TaxID=8496 RepID=A0A151PCS4_ALLMI|nr:hypothetical protein Y1Q_0014481 [Alligator mississippiensis]